MTYNLKNSPINKGAAANPSPMRSIGLLARTLRAFSYAGRKSYKAIKSKFSKKSHKQYLKERGDYTTITYGPGGHHKHTVGPEAIRAPKDAIVKRKVRAHTGFGPEADRNMTKLINE